MLIFAGSRILRSCRGEEDRVRDRIRAMVEAADDKDAADLMSGIAEDYRDRDGLSKEQLRYLVLAYFLQHRRIDVAIQGDIDVRRRPDGTATAIFYAHFAESALESLARGGETIRFEADLRRDDKGEWRVFTHRRERAR